MKSRKILQETIESKIFQIRGKKVMMDSDLARLYGVETKQLTRQVRRNISRFPEDFMFQLTEAEFLRCQFGTSNADPVWKFQFETATTGRGGRRYLPYVFTEQGVAMLSSVLNNERAVTVNIQIMRAFVSLRRIGLTYVGLKRKIDSMERKYDGQFKVVFQAIKELLKPPEKGGKESMGFHK